MTDGAHLGVGAERALKTILAGDPPPTRDEQMDVDAFRAWIEAAPDSPASYDDAARYAAKRILAFYQANPEAVNVPTNGQYEERDGEWVKTGPDLYDLISEADPSFRDLGLTGFQYGWAVNAARRCWELPPVPNPAIVTVGGE